jgi:hypothetical protein
MYCKPLFEAILCRPKFLKVARSCVAIVAAHCRCCLHGCSKFDSFYMYDNDSCVGSQMPSHERQASAGARESLRRYVETRRSCSAIKPIHTLSLVRPHKLHSVGIMVSQQRDSSWNIAGKTARHHSWCLSAARLRTGVVPTAR